MLAAFLEVAAEFDEFGAQGAHGGILFDAIAKWYDDRRRQAVARGAEGHRLAVVAARGRHHALEAGVALRQARHVDEAAAHLECARGGVVLVLDPGLGTQGGV